METSGTRAEATLAPGDTANFTLTAADYVPVVTLAGDPANPSSFPAFTLRDRGAALAAIYERQDGSIGFLGF